MKAGSMEGLIGASVNMKLLQTPMRVYRDARRRGDTEVMERAMGYASDFQERAQEYNDKAQKELPKELKEERKEQEIRQEQALQHKEEAKEQIEQVRENHSSAAPTTDSVTISEEGRNVLQNDSQAIEPAPMMEPTDIKMYTREGKPFSIESNLQATNRQLNLIV